MSRAAHIAALVASAVAAQGLLADGRPSWLGRFVTPPDAITNVAPADFPKSGLPLSATVYRTICALGDMTMERRFVPSKDGADSAPEGPTVTCMAEDGWETPRAARHAQVYDLAYDAINAGMGAAALDGGVTVYPLALGGCATSGLGLRGLVGDLEGNNSLPVLDAPRLNLHRDTFPPAVYSDSEKDATRAARGAFASMLSAHGILANYTGALTGSDDGFFNDAFDTYGFAFGDYEGATDEDYATRGGIKVGDPLYRCDPLFAYYALSRSNVSPVAIPSGAAFSGKSTRTNVTWGVSIASDALAEKMLALFADGGGEVDVATKRTRAETYEGDADLGFAHDAHVEINPDSLDHYVSVVWIYGAPESATPWEALDEWSQDEPAGTVTVYKRIGYGGRAVSMGPVTAHTKGYEATLCHEFATPVSASDAANEIAWPHASSLEWWGNDGSEGVGGCGDAYTYAITRRVEERQLDDKYGTEDWDLVGTNGVVAPLATSLSTTGRSVRGVLAETWRGLFSPPPDWMEEEKPPAAIRFTMDAWTPPEGSASSNTQYRVVFTPEDGTNGTREASFYLREPPFEEPATGDADALVFASRFLKDNDLDGATTANRDGSYSVTREYRLHAEDVWSEYPWAKRMRYDAPDVFLFLMWTFTTF